MTDSITLWFVGIELTITIAFFFSIYNPLKKKEKGLMDNSKITRIKRYFLKML
ncbi:MAG TPA: hypothetical protein VJB35_00985 [Candidatus Nanoarchaeia archaeon]|nr:hypothetical protein [Candidatus Nanoarchaeia archaeon]